MMRRCGERTKVWDVSLQASLTFSIFAEVAAPTAVEARELAQSETLNELLIEMRAPITVDGWTIDTIEAYSVKEQPEHE